jgi:hypothetical protein
VTNDELQNATENHNITPDGYDIGECPPGKSFHRAMCPYYNLGRNNLVSMAVGTTSFGGTTYNTVAQNITGLMASGSAG